MDLLDKYGYWLLEDEDTDKRRWTISRSGKDIKYYDSLEDLRLDILEIIEIQEGINFSTPKKQSDEIDRGPFNAGLSEEEIEERYRRLYERDKKHNRLDKKISRETKSMINETKKDYKDVVRIILVCVFLYGLANVLGKNLDELPDWIGTMLEVPLILGGLVLAVWLWQIIRGDSEK